MTSKSLAKIKALAEKSAEGSLTSFSGLFQVTDLPQKEKMAIESILMQYQHNDTDIHKDLESLISISSEVKAIHNQAALLHGERIKKAQTILKKYKDGAFTSYLIMTYGNRQTPYNFLFFYEFWQTLSQELKKIADIMPRQALYTLASRNAPLEKKQKLIESYKGETKREMLEIIRKRFPLEKDDKRAKDEGGAILTQLVQLFHTFKRMRSQISQEKKDEIKSILTRFLEIA
jgi:hypothetical protein